MKYVREGFNLLWDLFQYDFSVAFLDYSQANPASQQIDSNLLHFILLKTYQALSFLNLLF
jgi:hypothetical protein